MNLPVHIDAAKREIAAATTALGAKTHRDKAEAMRQYGIAAKDEALVRAAVEYKLRAERRLGELLAEADVTEQGHKNLKRGKQSSGVVPSRLRDAGISRDLSSKAQRIAKIPEAQFERALKESPLRPKLKLTPLNGKRHVRDEDSGFDPEELVERIATAVMRIATEWPRSEWRSYALLAEKLQKLARHYERRSQQ
jgi:hypothetical protein